MSLSAIAGGALYLWDIGRPDIAKSTPPASGHPRNETLPRILGALVDPRTAEDRLVCQVCDTKYGRRDSEK